MTERATPGDGLNVLFVFADQLHAFAVGCMGNPEVHTPNLDGLAERGVLFRNTYSSAPICTPMRANLFSGRYCCQTGALRNANRIPEGERTLADALNDGGYRTSYVGKWHLGGMGNGPIPEELRGGFREFVGYQCYNGFYQDVCFYDEAGREQCRDRHRTDVTTDLAIERLEGLAGKRFALFVSYQNPHYPVQPAAEFARLYEHVPITRRPNASDIDPYTRTFSPPSPPPDEDPDALRYGGDLDEYLRLYYAMVTQMDHGIGRLLRRLEELGLAENTAVVFTSDHGDMQGSHGLKNKTTFWEESTRIPMIAYAPGGAAGVDTPALMSSTDMYPTVLGLAGLPAEPGAEGRDYAPLILGRHQEENDAVFSEDRSGWFMIREGDLKLAVDRETFAATHLFDLASDPYELHNLVRRPEHAAACERLQRRLVAWHADVMSRARPEALGA
mgnify:CR=1 FL=1